MGEYGALCNLDALWEWIRKVGSNCCCLVVMGHLFTDGSIAITDRALTLVKYLVSLVLKAAGGTPSIVV